MVIHRKIRFGENRGKCLSSVALLIVVMLSVTGCYPSVNEYDARVTGTVTVDGELAPRGMVSFHPVSGGPVATGIIRKDGSYSLRTGQGKLGDGDGGTVLSGEYIVAVTVSLPATAIESEVEMEAKNNEASEIATPPANIGGPPPSGPMLSDAKYRSKATSPLRLSVKPGDNVFVLDLDRAEPEGAEENTEENSGSVESSEEAMEPNDEANEEEAEEAEEPTEPVEETEQSTESDDKSAETPSGEGSS